MDGVARQLADARAGVLNGNDLAALLDLVEETAGAAVREETALEAVHEVLNDGQKLGRGGVTDPFMVAAPMAAAGEIAGRGGWSGGLAAGRLGGDAGAAIGEGFGRVMAAEGFAGGGGAMATGAVVEDEVAERDGREHVVSGDRRVTG